MVRTFAAALLLAGACGGSVMAGGTGNDGSPETSASQLRPSDATVDAHFGSLDAATAGPDGGAAPVICNGGCLCFSTPDACAANRCTLASYPQSDGATKFECDNGPLGLICETGRGGRCLAAGATCANPAPQYGCDTWPSTGAFCCLDKPDAGVDSSGTNAADGGTPDGDGCACSPLYAPCGAPGECRCCSPGVCAVEPNGSSMCLAPP